MVMMVVELDLSGGDDFYLKIYDKSANQESDLLGPFSGWSNTNGTPMGNFSVATIYDFTLNNTPVCLPPYLPVECLSFKAQVHSNNTIQLKWSTVSELNNDYFSVERSNEWNPF